MAILKVRDAEGNVTEIPAIKGKSAYEYAKDGGYTGTEEEFAELMANGTGGGLVGAELTQAEYDALPEEEKNNGLYFIKDKSIIINDGISYGGITNSEDGECRASNPNLLINGDFQVWQRGTTHTITSNNFFADRWKLGGENTYKLDKASNGCSFSRSSGSANYIAINQPIEKVLPDGEYTLQISIDDVVYTVHFDKLSTAWDDYKFCDEYSGLKSALYVRNNDNTNLFIHLSKTSGVINWIKLEAGSIATPFEPRLYVEEFELCQRYCQVLSGDLGYPLNINYLENGVTNGSLYFPTVMRTAPTITFRNKQVGTMPASDITVNSITVDKVTDKVLTVKFTHTSISSNYRYAYVWLLADAEIY